MQCSVCGAEAEDISSGEFDGLIVRCKRCGEYEVADSVFNDFLRLDFNERVAALFKAQEAMAQGKRPSITAACL